MTATDRRHPTPQTPDNSAKMRSQLEASRRLDEAVRTIWDRLGLRGAGTFYSRGCLRQVGGVAGRTGGVVGRWTIAIRRRFQRRCRRGWRTFERRRALRIVCDAA